MKVVVHTKTGKSLAYISTATEEDIKSFWKKGVEGEGYAQFGRYIIPKTNIDYVELIS